MLSQQNDLQHQLDEARANALRLKNEHKAHLHAVATSPSKAGGRRVGSGKEIEAMKDVDRSIAFSASAVETSAAQKSRIPAYRPPSGTLEGHPEEIPTAADHVETLRPADQGTACVERVSMKSLPTTDAMATPLFLTKKKKAMHCELDEPGQDIPYPKNQMKKSFFQRLFGCFHKPSIYSPPRVTSHRPRPPSSGMVPMMLSLEKEVAPLQASLNTGADSEEERSMNENGLSMALPYSVLEGMHHEAVTIDEGVSHAYLEVTREDVYSSRLLRQQQQKKDQANHCMNSKIPGAPKAPPSSHSQSPTKQVRGPASEGALHQDRQSPVRMTKAQRLREQANLRKIEARHVAESKHFQAMPKAVRKSLYVPECGRRSSFLPQLRESLNASTFDEAKKVKIETAAAKVLAAPDAPEALSVAEADVQTVRSAASDHDYNPLMSMSLSDDPFYRELAKIDHTLTEDDLDKLREVLASSNLQLFK
jgi:hypothetical protein